MSVVIKPSEIEQNCMRIIAEELAEQGISLSPETEAVVKRVIHTTADFDYASNPTFTEGAVSKGIAALASGCGIVTDTNMAKAGIRRRTLENFGGTLRCFMADKDVAEEAKRRGITRASASMEHAARLEKETGKGAGDTHVVYPGDDGSVCSGMRLEAQRQGLEDWELIRLLQKKDPAKCDAIIRRVFRKFDDFTPDPVAIRKARAALLKALEAE